MNNSATPVSADERIDTLDAIRGFALVGIFIMNMPYFNTSFFAGADGTHLWPQWWDRSAETFRDVVFSGKFNSMFSMLFAIGFTIQLDRLFTREPGQAVGIYLRRIFWLFVFGVIHACVLWPGDILHMYALFGLLLLVIRKLPERVLIGIIVLCFLYPSIAGIVRMQTMDPDDVQRMVTMAQQWVAIDNEIYANGSFFDIATRNTEIMKFQYLDADGRLGMIGGYVQILTTMLFGLILGRRRFFQNVTATSRLGSPCAMVGARNRPGLRRCIRCIWRSRRESDAAVGVGHSRRHVVCDLPSRDHDLLRVADHSRHAQPGLEATDGAGNARRSHAAHELLDANIDSDVPVLWLGTGSLGYGRYSARPRARHRSLFHYPSAVDTFLVQPLQVGTDGAPVARPDVRSRGARQYFAGFAFGRSGAGR